MFVCGCFTVVDSSILWDEATKSIKSLKLDHPRHSKSVNKTVICEDRKSVTRSCSRFVVTPVSNNRKFTVVPVLYLQKSLYLPAARSRQRKGTQTRITKITHGHAMLRPMHSFIMGRDLPLATIMELPAPRSKMITPSSSLCLLHKFSKRLVVYRCCNCNNNGGCIQQRDHNEALPT